MLLAVIRGGGDLASGIAVRLHHVGIKVVITEIDQPLAVRRYVSFSEAVYLKIITIEDIEGQLIHRIEDIQNCHRKNVIPVIIDEEFSLCSKLSPSVVIDARMLKRKVDITKEDIPLKIGIGPGFFPCENCHCVVETKRGPFLGRVFWSGSAESDNGVPEKIGEFDDARVLRSPDTGIFKAAVKIGDIVEQGETVASVNKRDIRASFRGVVRGLIHEGLIVTPKMKVGDLDPRCDPLLCSLVSDKALAIGGGVLEAILTIPENRVKLSSWENNETY